jgi:membrane-associated protease RseP (regulator of RpoE activity)
MAVEAMRGCGYRKVGGIYLCGYGMSIGCDRLPFNLECCPTCGHGLKFSLGWKKVDYKAYASKHEPCHCHDFCPVCFPNDEFKYGIMWVGAKFYSPATFVEEAQNLGVSKRIGAIPRDFEIGKTWILLAHIDAGEKRVEMDEKEIKKLEDIAGRLLVAEEKTKPIKFPAIFYAFKPDRIEKLIKQSDATPEELEKLKERGITPVVVPDNDKDHCEGNAYYDLAERKKAEKAKQKTLEEAMNF